MVFEIWVDADSVPKGLRTIILRAAARLGLPCTFVADRQLPDVVQYIADDTFARRQKAREQGTRDPDELKAVKSATLPQGLPYGYRPGDAAPFAGVHYVRSMR